MACIAFSSSDSLGPGYLGAGLGRLDPWEGGLNFAGFSSTMTPGGASGLALLALGLDLFFEAWRTDVRTMVVAGVVNRVLHIAPR